MQRRILLTGANGRMGTEMMRRLNSSSWSVTPTTRQTMDICNFEDVDQQISESDPSLVLHLAAYTNVSKSETEKNICWQTNVIGTRHVMRAAQKKSIPVVYVSTDYVFDGKQGLYKEDDCPNPTGFYAISKLVAEEAAMSVDKARIIRTSFIGSEWNFKAAYVDKFTSADYIDVIGKELMIYLNNIDQIDEKILHVATQRKSIYDLVIVRHKNIERGFQNSNLSSQPIDFSLDTSQWESVKLRLNDFEKIEGS